MCAPLKMIRLFYYSAILPFLKSATGLSVRDTSVNRQVCSLSLGLCELMPISNFSGKSYRSSTDQLDTGWYFYHLYVPFIEKEKRSDHCHAVCGCAKCDWKLFHFIGNFDEIPYEIRKKPSGQDRTAAEGKFVAEATRRRRRILQSRILSYY